MAATHVQAKANQATAATTVTVTANAAFAVGNLVCVGVSVNSTTTPINTPTDDKGNRYTPFATNLATRVPSIQLFWSVITIAGATQVTATVDTAGTVEIAVDEFTGQNTPAIQSFAVVNRTSVDLQTSPVTVTIPATTVGNTLIVAVTNGDNKTVSTVTDNKSGSSNTYTKDKESGQASIWSTVVQGSCTTVTVTVSAGGSTTVHIDIMEVSGGWKLGIGTGNATNTIHKQSGTGVASTAAACTSMGTTPGSMVIACYVATGVRGWTPGTGYTRMTTGANGDQIIGFSEYKLNAGTSETAPATIDSAATWSGVDVEYLPTNSLQGTSSAGGAATGTSLSCNFGALSPTVGSLIWVFASSSLAQTYSAGASYTLGVTGTNAGTEYRLSATSSETAPFTDTSTGPWQEEAIEILLLPASTVSQVSMGLLGVG